MQKCIEDFAPRVALADPADRWWIDTKASDDFLDRVFEKFYKLQKLPNQMSKSNYHTLARFVPPELIAEEVKEVLNMIVSTAARAKLPPEP